MRISHRTTVAALAASLLLTGCASVARPSSEGSRSRLYSSVADLAADSEAVITGTVTRQHSATDIDPVTDFTISTVGVTAVVRGDIPVGSTVEVRQFGTPKGVGPAPLLVPGSDYLLYLTPSGLDGDLSAQYYVTGGSAGLYASSSAGGRGIFTQMQPDEGDRLPAALTLNEANG